MREGRPMKFPPRNHVVAEFASMFLTCVSTAAIRANWMNGMGCEVYLPAQKFLTRMSTRPFGPWATARHLFAVGENTCLGCARH